MVEATAGLVLGLFMLLLYLAISYDVLFSKTLVIVSLTGIGVGIGLTLAFSAMRRSTPATIELVLARSVPTFIASVIWLVMALTIIFS